MGSMDIISGLLARDIDLALQIIFLDLDPVSVKQSRLVCQQWSSFIKRRIVPKVRKRLLFQWENATPKPKSLLIDGSIKTLSCDESILVCGMSNGWAKVYNFITLDHITDLNCNPVNPVNPRKSLLSRLTSRFHKEKAKGVVYMPVHTDIGKNIVAAVATKGVVSVWRRADWSILYKKSLHSLQNYELMHKGWSTRIPFIKILPNAIIVLTSGMWGIADIKNNWTFDILSWDGSNAVEEDASVSDPTLDYLQSNTGIHLFNADEDYILLAKGNKKNKTLTVNLELWSLLSTTMVAKGAMELSSVEGCVRYPDVSSVMLSYPFAILGVVGPWARVSGDGAPANSGVISLNLHTGEIGNRIDFHTSEIEGLDDIHRNGFKLIALPDKAENKSVVMCSLEDLKNPVHQMDILKRVQKIGGPEDNYNMSSCINTAGVAVATSSPPSPFAYNPTYKPNPSELFVWDFWNCNVYDDEESWPHGNGGCHLSH